MNSSFLHGNTKMIERSCRTEVLNCFLFLGSLKFIIYVEGKVFVSLSCKIRNLLLIDPINLMKVLSVFALMLYSHYLVISVLVTLK